MVEPAGSSPPAHLRVRLRGGRRRSVDFSPGRAPAYLGSPQSTASASGRRAPPPRGLLLRQNTAVLLQGTHRHRTGGPDLWAGTLGHELH
jgi:hypothetical protein